MSNGWVSCWLPATRGTETPGLAGAHSDQTLLLAAETKVDNATRRFPLSCLSDNTPKIGLPCRILFLFSEKIKSRQYYTNFSRQYRKTNFKTFTFDL